MEKYLIALLLLCTTACFASDNSPHLAPNGSYVGDGSAQLAPDGAGPTLRLTERMLGVNHN